MNRIPISSKPLWSPIWVFVFTNTISFFDYCKNSVETNVFFIIYLPRYVAAQFVYIFSNIVVKQTNLGIIFYYLLLKKNTLNLVAIVINFCVFDTYLSVFFSIMYLIVKILTQLYCPITKILSIKVKSHFKRPIFCLAFFFFIFANVGQPS